MRIMSVPICQPYATTLVPQIDKNPLFLKKIVAFWVTSNQFIKKKKIKTNPHLLTFFDRWKMLSGSTDSFFVLSPNNNILVKPYSRLTYYTWKGIWKDVIIKKAIGLFWIMYFKNHNSVLIFFFFFLKRFLSKVYSYAATLFFGKQL